MRRLTFVAAAVLLACGPLAACGDDGSAKLPGTVTSPAKVDQSAADPGSTRPPTAGNADCAALKDSLTKMIVNWQVVIGLAHSPTSEWSQIPLGTLPEFGAQLALITAALGGDAEAADALAFMSGANDIVQRGVTGDTTAEADLSAYLGSDIAANVGKQLPISLAYDATDCG